MKNTFRYDILLKSETCDMKTKYFVLAGIAGFVAAVWFFSYHRGIIGIKSNENTKKQTGKAEKHIRGTMNKSKLAL